MGLFVCQDEPEGCRQKEVEWNTSCWQVWWPSCVTVIKLRRILIHKHKRQILNTNFSAGHADFDSQMLRDQDNISARHAHASRLVKSLSPLFHWRFSGGGSFMTYFKVKATVSLNLFGRFYSLMYISYWCFGKVLLVGVNSQLLERYTSLIHSLCSGWHPLTDLHE